MGKKPEQKPHQRKYIDAIPAHEMLFNATCHQETAN